VRQRLPAAGLGTWRAVWGRARAAGLGTRRMVRGLRACGARKQPRLDRSGADVRWPAYGGRRRRSCWCCLRPGAVALPRTASPVATPWPDGRRCRSRCRAPRDEAEVVRRRCPALQLRPRPSATALASVGRIRGCAALLPPSLLPFCFPASLSSLRSAPSALLFPSPCCLFWKRTAAGRRVSRWCSPVLTPPSSLPPPCFSLSFSPSLLLCLISSVDHSEGKGADAPRRRHPMPSSQHRRQGQPGRATSPRGPRASVALSSSSPVHRLGSHRLKTESAWFTDRCIRAAATEHPPASARQGQSRN